jgi:HSP20 family protein
MRAFTTLRGITPRNSLDRYVDDFFNDTVRRVVNRPDIDSNEMTVPSANIHRNGESSYVIEVAAPGFSRDDFEVNTHNGILTISGERKVDQKTEGEREYARREFNYLTFNRSFTLPENTLEEKISAAYRDGILKVSVPVRSEDEGNNQPRRIDIS